MKQRLSIDVEILDRHVHPAQHDSLKDALDYSKVAAVVMQVCQSRAFHLIETVAEQVASRVLADFPTPQVRVLVRKISPVLEPRVSYVSVEIVRSSVIHSNIWYLPQIFVEDFKFIALFLRVVSSVIFVIILNL